MAASGSLGARVEQRARELATDVAFGLALEDSAVSTLAQAPDRPWAYHAVNRIDQADVALARMARALSREGMIGQIVHAAIAAHLDGNLAGEDLADLARAVDQLDAWAQPAQRVISEALDAP